MNKIILSVDAGASQTKIIYQLRQTTKCSKKLQNVVRDFQLINCPTAEDARLRHERRRLVRRRRQQSYFY